MATFTSFSPLPGALTYAGIPFVTDVATAIRRHDTDVTPAASKQRPLTDIVAEINRVYKLKYLSDFSLPSAYPGRNLGGVALRSEIGPQPDPDSDNLYDFYYPTTVSRWSVFRGLATSSQAKAMLAATQGNMPAFFYMSQMPVGAINPVKGGQTPSSAYSISTELFMLPPRPLVEFGTGLDGLYLITLVDERFYFQGTPASLQFQTGTTWQTLIASIATQLGIVISYSAIPAVYGVPEPDSSLWCNAENAATLLDAVAYNLGRVVIRYLNGTYALQTYAEAQQVVTSNRGQLAGVVLGGGGSQAIYNTTKTVRVAGGDIFQSGSSNLKIGSLAASRNAVVPARVTVSFPKYVYGDDPVPHFLNPRYANPRPSAWIEDSYGDVYTIAVPIAQNVITLGGGGSTSVYTPASPMVSGLTGTSEQYLHTTAKALYATEFGASYSAPDNYTSITALARQLAKDYYEAQVAAALDEVYPGIWAWTPEAIHDIIWRWGEKDGLITTRVSRNQWNLTVTEFQHSTPTAVNFNGVPRGVGGPTVAQTVRDQTGVLGIAPTTTNLTLAVSTLVGETVLFVISPQNVVDAKPFYAKIDSEVVLVISELLFDLPSSTWKWTVLRAQQNTALGAHSFSTPIYRIGPAPVLSTLGYPSFFVDSVVVLNSVDNLPTDQRWRGQIDGEVFLFDGTSGGLTGGAVLTAGSSTSQGSTLTAGFYTNNFLTATDGRVQVPGAVSLGGGRSLLLDAIYIPADKIADATEAGYAKLDNAMANPNGAGILLNNTIPVPPVQNYLVTVAQRPLDGTVAANHNYGATVIQLTPNTNYGTNLVTYGQGQYAFPAEATSGGIAGINVVPQTQTVQALTSVGEYINDVIHYSGRVVAYDPTQSSGATYFPTQYCWLTERNDGPMASGQRYGGQFMGYSAAAFYQSSLVASPAPVYAVSQNGGNLAVQDTRYCTILTSGCGLQDSTIGVASKALFPTTGLSVLPVLIKVGNEEMAIVGPGVTNGTAGTWQVVRGVNFVVEEHPNYEPVCQVFSRWAAECFGGTSATDNKMLVRGVRNFPITGRFYALIDAEIVLVTDRELFSPDFSESTIDGQLGDFGDDDTWNWYIDRGQLGTVAGAHAVGAAIFQWLPDPPEKVARIVFDDSAFVQPGTPDPATGAPTAVHHEVSQMVRITSNSPNASGLYSAFLQKWEQATMTWVDDTLVWVVDLNQTSSSSSSSP